MIERVASLCGATHPDRAAARARGAPGRPARGGRARRGLRHRPGRGAAGRGRARRAPLHAQPLTRDARDRLRPARPRRVARGDVRRPARALRGALDAASPAHAAPPPPSGRARPEVVGRDQVQRERVPQARGERLHALGHAALVAARRSSCGTRPAGGPARACRRGCAAPSATSCSPSSAARRASRRTPLASQRKGCRKLDPQRGHMVIAATRRSYSADRTEGGCDRLSSTGRFHTGMALAAPRP